MALAAAPDTLTTFGLGSCVGIALYDRTRKIGGLSHILLPKAPPDETSASAKYADTAIGELIGRLTAAGANPRALTAKLAGGASMFARGGGDMMQIGRRNVEMCREILSARVIPVIAEDTGGTVGRTIVFDCETGVLLVRTAWPKAEKTL